MKKLASICLLFVCALAMCGQSSTPNIGLQIPATGSNNWYIPLNYNFTKLDLLLSGNSPLPNLTVTGNGTFNGVVTAAGFAGPGGSGSALTTGAAQYSPAYFSAPGTGFVINGVAPFNGAAYYSTSAAPRAWLSSDIANLLKASASGCNVAGGYNPFTNTCIPGGGGGGSGTVTDFSSGNLSPLFTTSITNSTSTPALSFSLSNTATGKFFGNFSGSTTAPDYWNLVAGTNVAFGINSGTKTLTLNATSGGSVANYYTSGNFTGIGPTSFTPTVPMQFFAADTTTGPSQNPQVLMAGTLSGATIYHGIACDFVLNVSQPFNCYDDRTELTGSGAVDHNVSFQSIHKLLAGYSGTLSRGIGAVAYNSVLGGTMTDSIGFEVDDSSVSGSGAITNQTGVWIKTLTAASGNKYAFRSDGNSSLFGLGATGTFEVNVGGTSTSFAVNFFQPNLASGGSEFMTIGKVFSAHNAGFFGWQNTTVPNFAIATYEALDPIYLSANQIWSQGAIAVGCTACDPSIATVLPTLPGVLNAGTTSQFFVSSAGAVTAPSILANIVTTATPSGATGGISLKPWGSVSTYNAISLNGLNTATTMIGLVGGNASDPSLYLDVPSGGSFVFGVNNSLAAAISSTGIDLPLAGIIGWNSRDTTMSRGGPGQINVGVNGDASGTIDAANYAAGNLLDGVRAVTQSANDNSTKVATTAYVDATAQASGHFAYTPGNLTTGSCANTIMSTIPGTNSLSIVSASLDGTTSDILAALAALTITPGYNSSLNEIYVTACNHTGSTWTDPTTLHINIGRLH